MFYCLLPIALKLYLIAGAKIGSADFLGWFEAVPGICDEALRGHPKPSVRACQRPCGLLADMQLKTAMRHVGFNTSPFHGAKRAVLACQTGRFAC